MNKLKGKIALVTSGTRGIGLQCVKTLAQNGATVYIGARRLEVADQICKDLSTQGFTAKSVYFDATKTETYESMIDTVIKEAGRLDILVNNYGGTDA
ncbi:MAG: SDR family NAD(P)-dependent oxidoreductase [Turicibacter sp.]|nr:SDR family NAD(P)-dependent oxidoreductase [Turicibacter sp.]